MKKFKVLSAAVLATVMAFSPVSVFADTSNAVKVQLNGENLSFDDAQPLVVGGRVYVPFRTVFEGLNANVSYDQETQKITASKEDTTVAFVIGDQNVSVTSNGQTQVVDTDAASFVKNNRTYVPVRFAAQALNCNVGWDEMSKTVIIIDASIINSVTYDIVTKYFEYAQSLKSEGNYATSGNITFDFSATQDSEKIAVSGTTKISGLSSQTVANLDMAVEMDLSSIKTLLESYDSLDSQTSAVLASLGKFDINFILNTETGKLYAKSQIFDLVLGTQSGAWILWDFKDMLKDAGVDYSTLLTTSSNAEIVAAFNGMVDNISLDDSYASANAVEAVKVVQSLFADQNLTKTADGYSSSYTVTEGGVTFSANIAFTLTGEDVTGMSIVINVTDTTNSAKVAITQKGLVSDVNLNFKSGSDIEFNMKGNIEESLTTQVPSGAPTSGEIVDMSTMY